MDAKKPVTVLAAHPSKHLLVSGHSDGSVRMWEYQAQKIINTFDGMHLSPPDYSVYNPPLLSLPLLSPSALSPPPHSLSLLSPSSLSPPPHSLHLLTLSTSSLS